MRLLVLVFLLVGCQTIPQSSNTEVTTSSVKEFGYIAGYMFPNPGSFVKKRLVYIDNVKTGERIAAGIGGHFLFPLKPGKYYFSMLKAGQSGSTVPKKIDRASALMFDVKAGKVSYVGSLLPAFRGTMKRVRKYDPVHVVRYYDACFGFMCWGIGKSFKILDHRHLDWHIIYELKKTRSELLKKHPLIKGMKFLDYSQLPG